MAVGDRAGGNRKSSLTTIALNIRNTILTGGKPPPPRPKSESEPTEGSVRAPTKVARCDAHRDDEVLEHNGLTLARSEEVQRLIVNCH